MINVTKDGPKIVELGARLGGDCITTHLVPLSTGVDMVESSIQIALGEQPNLYAKNNYGSAIRYEYKKGDTIVTVYAGEDGKYYDSEDTKTRKEIEFIEEIKSSIDRIGFVISQSDSAQKAIKIAEQAINLIKIEVNN